MNFNKKYKKTVFECAKVFEMESIRMPSIPGECAATSLGTANELLLTMFKLLIYAQCKISPPEMWPRDYGEVALEKGRTLIFFKSFFFRSNEFFLSC